MADFTALKAEIQNYVKQNGNNAITGDGLQAILISMVQALGDSAINDLASSLSNEVLARQGADTTLQGNIDAANTAITTLATFIGNGYMFRGIATLETVPSALGGKVFYITATAGQYTNMGGITVSEGVSILAYDGTSWSASLLIGIDATPTNGSNGLVRSGGVYTSLTQENARALAAETASAEFNSTTKKLIFKNSAGTVLYEMDATPFIVDGMVDDVYISGGNLIISFNTDAGKQDISIPLTAIFNPANYYDKTAIDALLLPITTRLAAGYIYMGLATPSGTPDTSVGKVFYLTATAGTYTSYGNLTVNAGITILSYNGSVWSADLLVAIDSTPTQNSNGLVTSGGVFTAIKTVADKLAEGYLYKGIATAATDPSTPSTKVFYIATAAGTYTNFANTQVSEGITILKYDGTNWTKEQVLFLDGGVFDISAYNLSGDPLAPTKYADLEAALGTNGANIPAAIRKGGMSVKFVRTSDNTYVQYRLKLTTFSLNEENWEKQGAAVSVSQDVQRGYDTLNIGVNVGGRFSDAYKLIKLFGMQSSRPEGISPGDIYYHTYNKLLYKVLPNTTLETIPFYDGAIYQYNNELYVWDGNNMVKVGTNVSQIPNENTENYLSAIQIGEHKYSIKDEGLGKIVPLQYIDTYYSAAIQKGEYYLNSSDGKLYQSNGNTRLEQPLHDGMLVSYKGALLMYSASIEKWIPRMSEDKSVPCATDKNFRWKAVSGGALIMGDVTSTGGTGGCAIKQRINKGDIIVVHGYGSASYPVLAITDNSYIVKFSINSVEGAKSPVVLVSEWDGYVFHNYAGDTEHYLYLSSCKKEIEIIGIFGSNPKNDYNYPFPFNSIYYKTDGLGNKFILNSFNGDGVTPNDITNYILAFSDKVRIVCGAREYTYDLNMLYELKHPKKYSLDTKILSPLTPQTVENYLDGINFTYPTYLDEIYAKFDALATNYPSIVTKYDAVELINDSSFVYPLYCNLNGQESGDYYATPTYRINLYRIGITSTSAVNQSTYNKKTRIFIISGVHPYEIAAPANVYLFFRNLIENRANMDSNIFQILANTEFYVLPVLNGYGIYNYAHGFDRINANGVNINRNYPTIRWKQGEAGQNYGGDSAGSEFEAQLVMRLTNMLSPYICLDCHNFDDSNRQFFTTFGIGDVNMEQILYNYFVEMSRKLKVAYSTYFGTGFGYITGSDYDTIIEDVEGSTSDWWNLNAKVKDAITFEISRYINYNNGAYVGSGGGLDSYGNTLFSCNELGLRTVLCMLLNRF